MTVTPEEWIKRYVTYLTVVKNLRPNSVRAYVKDAELLHRFLKIDDWAKVDDDMAAEYVQHVKEIGKATSLARKLYALKYFFRFLRKQRATLANPFDEFDCHAAARPLPQTLTVAEMQKLLNRIRQPIPAFLGVPSEESFLTVRDRAMLEVLYSAALRVSELVGLNWDDIDYHKREVKIVCGKGGKQRFCPLGQKALDALLEYSRHYKLWWDNKPEGLNTVFLSTWDRRILTRTIPRTIHKWCDLAGVKRVNPHAFRHSCATHMLENGADIRIVQAILGHASLATTQIYTHVATRLVKSVHANTHPRA